MPNHFMYGLCDELEKSAAHPLFETVTKGGTLLGKRVKGMMNKAVRRAKKARGKARRGAGLKGKTRLKKKAEDTTIPGQKPPQVQPMPSPVKPETVGGPKMPKLKAQAPPPPPTTTPPANTMEKRNAAAPTAEDAGRQLKEVIDQAQVHGNKNQQVPMGVTDPDFGGGTGNFKGRQAMPYTASTKGGKRGNPQENPENFPGKTAGIGGKLLLGALGAGGLYAGSKAIKGGKKAVEKKETRRKDLLANADYGTGCGTKKVAQGIGTPPMTGGGMTPPASAPANVGPSMGTGTGARSARLRAGANDLSKREAELMGQADMLRRGAKKTAGIGSKLMLGAAGIPIAAALGTIAHEETKGKKKKPAPPPAPKPAIKKEQNQSMVARALARGAQASGR